LGVERVQDPRQERRARLDLVAVARTERADARAGEVRVRRDEVEEDLDHGEASQVSSGVGGRQGLLSAIAFSGRRTKRVMRRRTIGGAVAASRRAGPLSSTSAITV